MDTSALKHYTGDIKPEPNTIFVFGSNPEGRHGAGAAKVAREQFGRYLDNYSDCRVNSIICNFLLTKYRRIQI